MIPTIANGQSAAVAYQCQPKGNFHEFGLGIPAVTDTGIARIFVFGGLDLIVMFGLQAVHSGTDIPPGTHR